MNNISPVSLLGILTERFAPGGEQKFGFLMDDDPSRETGKIIERRE